MWKMIWNFVFSMAELANVKMTEIQACIMFCQIQNKKPNPFNMSKRMFLYDIKYSSDL